MGEAHAHWLIDEQKIGFRIPRPGIEGDGGAIVGNPARAKFLEEAYHTRTPRLPESVQRMLD